MVSNANFIMLSLLYGDYAGQCLFLLSRYQLAKVFRAEVSCLVLTFTWISKICVWGWMDGYMPECMLIINKCMGTGLNSSRSPECDLIWK